MTTIGNFNLGTVRNTPISFKAKDQKAGDLEYGDHEERALCDIEDVISFDCPHEKGYKIQRIGKALMNENINHLQLGNLMIQEGNIMMRDPYSMNSNNRRMKFSPKD